MSIRQIYANPAARGGAGNALERVADWQIASPVWFAKGTPSDEPVAHQKGQAAHQNRPWDVAGTTRSKRFSACAAGRKVAGVGAERRRRTAPSAMPTTLGAQANNVPGPLMPFFVLYQKTELTHVQLGFADYTVVFVWPNCSHQRMAYLGQFGPTCLCCP